MDCQNLASICFGLLLCVAQVSGVEKQTPASAPPLPSIKALTLQPESLTLADGRDERRVLVWGKTEDDELIDLTGVSTFTATPLDPATIRPCSLRTAIW